MIASIAILHAVPVFHVGLLFRNRELLWAAAILMTVIAALTGNSKYFLWDFIGIAVGFAVSLTIINAGGKST